MKVYTYYEPVSGWPREDVMDLWQSTWAAHGWEPVILSRKDAEKHPQHDVFMSVVSTLPTVNDRRYEDECYRRHLAYQQVAGGGAVFTDYDVLNIGLKPRTFSHRIISLAHGINTCAFWADRSGMDDLLLLIYGSNQIRSNTHNSDMTIFQSIHLKDPIPACYDLDGPSSGLLLHLSNRSCQPRSRAEWLPAVRTMLKVRQIRHRDSLHTALPLEGSMVEVGVAGGDFSYHNMCKSKVRYHGVDAFDDSLDPLDPMSGDGGVEARQNAAASKFRLFKHGSLLVSHPSTVAAEGFLDGSIDCAYIDACHQFPSVQDDLKAWWPKVRSGGILCAHDYNLPSHARNSYPWTEGVFWAVNQFIAEQKIPLSFVHTWECGTVVLVKP